MKLLVTGGSGTLGSEICRVAISDGITPIAYARDPGKLLVNTPRGTIGTPGDIQDIHRLVEICRKHEVTAVVHCAASKHVGACEESPSSACDINIRGVQNVLQAMDVCGISRGTFVSSDKACDSTVYGMSKLFGERLVSEAARQRNQVINSVRLGNLIGSHGSVVDIWKRAAREHQPIILHTYMGETAKRFAMHTTEAARFVLDTLDHDANPGAVFFRDMPVLDMDVLRQAVAPEADVILKPMLLRHLHQAIVAEYEQHHVFRNDSGACVLDYTPRGTVHSDSVPCSTKDVLCLGLHETREWLNRLPLVPIDNPRNVCS